MAYQDNGLGNIPEEPDWHFDCDVTHELLHSWQEIEVLFEVMDRTGAHLLPNTDLLHAALRGVDPVPEATISYEVSRIYAFRSLVPFWLDITH